MFIVESKVAKCTECHEQVYVSVLTKAVEYKHCLLPCYYNSELKGLFPCRSWMNSSELPFDVMFDFC